jgi:hypothetical protein
MPGREVQDLNPRVCTRYSGLHQRSDVSAWPVVFLLYAAFPPSVLGPVPCCHTRLRLPAHTR